MNQRNIKRTDLGFNSELMLFQPPVVNSGVDYVQWMECRPLNQLTEEGSVDLQVTGQGSQYLDLQRSRLYVKAQIVKEDGSKVTAEEKVSPSNLWLQSLFSQVDVYFEQKLVSSAGSNYAYKAYLDVLLSYGIDAKESQCQTQLYYKDSAGAMDQIDPLKTPINQGLIRRNDIAKESAIVDMEGNLFADVFQMPRYLLNEVEVRIKMFQSKNPFRLMA